MTISYYEYSSSALAYIRKWYESRYGVPITKKHAVMFAINNIEILPTNIMDSLSRFRILRPRVYHVGQTDHKRTQKRLKTFMLGNSNFSVPAAVSVCIIACALNIKKNPQLNVSLYLSNKHLSREQQRVEDQLQFLDNYNP